MQRRYLRLLIGMMPLILMLAVASPGVLAQSGTNALVRFVHAIPGASAVDIYTNNQLTLAGLEFGASSSYINVPSGAHQVTVTQSGATTPLWEQQITATIGSAYTLVASTTDPLGFQVFEDNLSPTLLGNARLTAIIHAIADGPPVDVVLADGSPVAPDLEYNQAYGEFDLPAFAYDMTAVPTGETLDNALLPLGQVPLVSGTSNMLVLFGTSGSPQSLLLTAATHPDADSGFVRIAHAVTGVEAVDVYINDTLVAPSLAFGGSTPHLALPVGDHDIALRVAGGEDAVASSSLSVTSGSVQTVVALDGADSATLEVFNDDTSIISEQESAFSVINALSGDTSVALTLASGETLLEDVGAGEVEAAAIAPSDSGAFVTAIAGSARTELELPLDTLYGGVYYSVIALEGENGPEAVLLPPLSVAQSLASAPGASETVTTSEVVAETTAPEVIIITATPPSEVVVAPTPVPQVVTAAPPAAASPAPSGPTARIVLDPDANLHLRQFPSADALSLGLAPSGATLLVNGREGAPLPPENATPVPNATPWLDPVTLLPGENADLLPEATWLNVTYPTPDGGTITAWVNALYLDLRDARGRRMRLADLPMVAGNQAGEARNTDITPPPVPENVVSAVVTNLDSGVNLHLRRTANSTGESLALLAGGTTTELLGLTEDQQWAFVRYFPTDGGTITGWVNRGYVNFSYRGNPIDIVELQERELLVFVAADTRGEARGAAPVSAPTQDPLRDAIVAEVIIDQGANLHLRRTPNANAESLILIPSGSRLVVTSRTPPSDWLEATFEGETGWVSSAYVRLTLNGRPFDLANVPVNQGVPTLTPTPLS